MNVDEDKVPDYTLPDPLVCADGTPVRSAAAWWDVRRPEILGLYADQVYGRTPDAPFTTTTEVREQGAPALDGRAARTQVRLGFEGPAGRAAVDVLLHLPAAAAGPVPVFVGLNFSGNQTVHPDPGIEVSQRWVAGDAPAARGVRASRWPIARIVERGYGTATAYCGDLFPDHAGGRPDSVAALFDPDPGGARGPHAWGALGAWAWGLSRMADLLRSMPEVDGDRLIVHGHSRLGKAALWAGAQDQRFAMAVSNDSGCGGAAIFRREVGETIAAINDRFPHWFCEAFRAYGGGEQRLPVDQHQLIGLIAPRPVCIASAAEDLWADPRGEFLGGLHATPVYELLGVEGLAASEWPAAEHPVTSRVGYHLRSGGHDITAYDWDRYLDAADRHLP